MWILVGNLFYAAAQYFILIALIRFTQPEAVGQFSLALAINAPISLFFSMSLRSVLISDSKNQYSSHSYVQLRVIAAGLAILLSLAISLVGKFNPLTTKIILVVAVIKAFETLADIAYGFFQKNGRNDLITGSMMIRGAVTSGTCILILMRTSNLLFMCTGMLCSTMLAIFIYDIPRLRSLKITFHRTNPNIPGAKALLRLAAPLGFATLFGSLEVNFPRYLIENHIGLSALGVFSAISYPLVLGNQIVGALASAGSPQLASSFQQSNYRMFRRLVLKMTLIGGLLGLGSSLICLLFGRRILELFHHPEYSGETFSFSILAFSAALSYVTVFFGAALSAMQCFQEKFQLQVLSFSAILLFSIFAARYHSIRAMCYALLAGSAVSLVAQSRVFILKYNKSLLALNPLPHETN
ncbi:MAG: oligosaccharide flippase family protein [Methylotenera sp.]|nr:oligosaccharide flippase family protein [Oligoflexia bacterium]